MTARDDWPAYMREYRSRTAATRCGRCSRAGLLTPTRCALCLAYDLERKPWLKGMLHDTVEHARWLTLARWPRSRCAVTGLTLQRLRRGGLDGRAYSLQVDRIRSGSGYVAGNMQLLACRLNRAKQGFHDVPRYAIDDLLADLGLADWPPLSAFMSAERGY